MSKLPWPLFALRIRTPRIELRAPTDDDLGELLDVARAGVHAPAVMPFIFPWTDRTGAAFDRGFLQYFWGARAGWTCDAWNLPLAVRVDGRAVGTQSIEASRFALFRSVDTGSWIGRGLQGRGLGTEMREAIVHFAFDTLGATFANSGAFEDNTASARVSEKLGYVPNGERLHAPRGAVVRERRYRLDRATWAPRRRDDVVIEGFDSCAEMFGVGG